MRDTIKRAFPLYILLFVYLLINTLMRFTSLRNIYVTIFNPLLLLSLAIITYFLTDGFRNRNRNKYLKRQNVIIIIVGYCIIYYLSGLIFGFLKNGYSLSLKGIISNFISLFTVVLFKEYIRYRLLCVSKKSLNIYLTTLIFILLDIDFYYILDINNSINLLDYIFSTIVPIIILNITLTYLAIKVNLTANLLYRAVITGIMLFSPIIPNHAWIVTNFSYLVILILLIASIDYLSLLDDRKSRKRELKKEKGTWIFLVIAFIFIFFVIGVFKYQPIAIMSNSMYDYFARGDAVIIEKIRGDEVKKVKIGDVIHYRHNGTYITHRVIDIQNNGDSYIYHTKGDNNETSDNWDIYETDINGIIRYRIKYLGWPSVWLYELLS